MDTLDYFLTTLAVLVLSGLALFIVAVALCALVDFIDKGDPFDVFTNSPTGIATREGNVRLLYPPATDRCVSCDRPVLVENTRKGVCSDCSLAVGDVLHAWGNDNVNWPDAQDHPVDCQMCASGIGSIHNYEPMTDDQWQDRATDEWEFLMSVIDDEGRDIEDHR